MTRLAVTAALALALAQGAYGQGIIGGGGGSGSGSGTVNTGTTPQLNYYPSSSNETSPTPRLEYDGTNFGIQVKDSDGDVRTRMNSVYSIFSADGATETCRFQNDGFVCGSDFHIRLGSSTSYNSTKDVGICRTAAGTIGISDGLACNANGTLAVASIDIGGGGPFTSSFQFGFTNGGSALADQQTWWYKVPYACDITSYDLTADQSGSVVIDLWVDTYANFPPTNADSITASATPTLSSAQTATDSTLTGWTTTIAAGSYLMATVEGAATSITAANLAVQCTRQ